MSAAHALRHTSAVATPGWTSVWSMDVFRRLRMSLAQLFMSMSSVSYYLILSKWIWLPSSTVWWVDYSLSAIADTFLGTTEKWMDESGLWCGFNKNGPIGSWI